MRDSSYILSLRCITLERWSEDGNGGDRRDGGKREHSVQGKPNTEVIS
jgi:hypothetical protein